VLSWIDAVAVFRSTTSQRGRMLGGCDESDWSCCCCCCCCWVTSEHASLPARTRATCSYSDVQP